MIIADQEIWRLLGFRQISYTVPTTGKRSTAGAVWARRERTIVTKQVGSNARTGTATIADGLTQPSRDAIASMRERLIGRRSGYGRGNGEIVPRNFGAVAYVRGEGDRPKPTPIRPPLRKSDAELRA
jgi:hypothetical protein